MQVLLSNIFESVAVCLLSNDDLDDAIGYNSLSRLLKGEGIDVDSGRKPVGRCMPEFAYPSGQIWALLKDSASKTGNDLPKASHLPTIEFPGLRRGWWALFAVK
jgi:hypothetical protein